MATRVLVIATSGIGAEEVSSALGDRFGEGAEVRVVAPASGLSRLDWLTNAEDDARSDAAARAGEVAEALPADPVDAEVGDSDPLQAIDDAVRTFAPHQVVLVTKDEDEETWLEAGTGESARHRFGVPVTHLVVH
jgi:hypothetical protein